MSRPFKLKYKNSAFPFKSPLKHDASYSHSESMHDSYSPEEMDRIKKEDPDATFELEKDTIIRERKELEKYKENFDPNNPYQSIPV